MGHNINFMGYYRKLSLNCPCFPYFIWNTALYHSYYHFCLCDGLFHLFSLDCPLFCRVLTAMGTPFDSMHPCFVHLKIQSISAQYAFRFKTFLLVTPLDSQCACSFQFCLPFQWWSTLKLKNLLKVTKAVPL